tara:strand:+ start:456 stop:1022 length:567 start_codon:yes stop_codon:yes gene_type:complete
MNRGSTTAFQNEVVKSANRPVHLAEIIFDDENVYMNDGYKTITYDSKDYVAVGNFMGFSAIQESVEVVVSKISMSLSGVDQSMISRFLNKEYIDRPVKIYTAFLDDAQVLVANPVLIFEGRMDTPVISDDPIGGKSMMSVTATNSWVDFTRKTGRHTNHEEQQIFFAGDKGFEYASEIVKDIVWGKAG